MARNQAQDNRSPAVKPWMANANKALTQGTNTEASASGQKVIVACKLPHGIHMDLHGAPGKALRRVSLRGSNDVNAIGGWGLTQNVPKEFFDKWMEVNSELPAVVNGLIRSWGDAASSQAAAQEHAEVTNELEPLPQLVETEEPGKLSVRTK